MTDGPVSQSTSKADAPPPAKKKGMALYTKILIGMAVGVGLGLLIGPNSFLLPQTGVQMTPSAMIMVEKGGEKLAPWSGGVRMAKIVEETDDGKWLRIEWTLSASDLLKARKGKPKTSPASLTSDGKEPTVGMVLSGWVVADPGSASRFSPIGQGIVDYTEWIGLLFLAMIKMVVVPLVFLSLVVGVASLGDFRKLGRLGGRTIGFFMGTTVVALTIGVGLANLFQPGRVLSAEDKARMLASYSSGAGDKISNAANAPSFVDQMIGIVPTNPVNALASGDMLQIIFFALMLGIALTFLKGNRAQLVIDVFDRLNEAVVMLVHIAMYLAPVGVAALLFKVVGSTGLSVLLALGYYGLIVLLGLAIHVAFTYGLAVKLGAKLPLFQFLGAIKEALLVAFSTSSSSATLPVTKECCEQNLNISPSTTSFVLPLGATVNMDGTALYQGVAAIFIAQIYLPESGPGALTIMDQVTIVGSATLASVGAAGVPGAGMITLALVLTAVGIPVEGIALILGVDRILDMFRTATNVAGDSTATALMARLEGEPIRIMTDEEDAANPDAGFVGRLDAGPHPVPTDHD
jgi:proton glutamate symport protein